MKASGLQACSWVARVRGDHGFAPQVLLGRRSNLGASIFPVSLALPAIAATRAVRERNAGILRNRCRLRGRFLVPVQPSSLAKRTPAARRPQRNEARSPFPTARADSTRLPIPLDGHQPSPWTSSASVQLVREDSRGRSAAVALLARGNGEPVRCGGESPKSFGPTVRELTAQLHRFLKTLSGSHLAVPFLVHEAHPRSISLRRILSATACSFNLCSVRLVVPTGDAFNGAHRSAYPSSSLRLRKAKRSM